MRPPTDLPRRQTRPHRLGLVIVAVVVFVLLLLLVMAVVGVINEVLSNQAVQGQLLAAVVILALLWWLYLQLPHFIQNMFRSLWRKPKKDKHQH